MTTGMGEVWNATQMVTSMRGNSRTINRMARESTAGSMARFMMASGRVVLKRVKAYGKGFLGIHTSASGHRVKLMATVFISGRMVIDTKENGNSV
jgi:hypothetical protein